MSYQTITYAREGSVALITLNQPERFNPLGTAMIGEVRDALSRVRDDKSVRALLVTANGKLFSSGADLGGGAFHAGSESRGTRAGNSMRNALNPMIAELHELPVPVVIALNGGAAGGGVGLALAADIVIATRSAYFYLPFIKKLALVPDAGASWFLQRRIGTARTLALCLTGERLSAEKAEQWGLIHACVEDEALAATAMEMAQQLARLPAHGVIEARQICEAASRNDLRSQLDYEVDRQQELFDLPTLEEGIKAFFEKRDPHFAGRE
ncbi:1,2-epoxyphenylacetyl-CoA isomerase [Pseudomonas fluorescens]|uniref:1,2-epoxyphenylacetyl-CoA isomerase n=1 Tax=Pseudomonas fluorescens TaxID=294 RepID=A0A5E7MNS8_PSEFL|nr:enoyl-CoA hydratase-related protein [Pseudomonas fluorescens]VVN47035.1 1,2-epoxyphenylacetyl-CoA isomerase [Pseudomonas fluorescens]VVP26233.1 1,2-epoxyphenylacetyl-CoA isomerase [Pseudomonas fluorescens]